MPKYQAALDGFIRYLLVITFAAVPLFFLPFTQNYYDTNKFVLLTGAGCLLLILWGARTMIGKVIAVSVFPRVLAFAALTAASFVATLISSPNKVEALIVTSGAVTFLTLTLMVFTGSVLSNRTFTQSLKWGLIVSASLLSVIAVYTYFGIGKLMFPGVAFLADPLWTPVGSSLALIAVLAMVLPLTVDEIALKRDEQNDALLAVAAVCATVMVIAIGITVFQFIPKLPTTVLPLVTSWAVTLEMFKLPKAMLFGVGPENFLGAFTTSRPVEFNVSPLWNARFGLSGSAVLHLATTLGLLGIGALIVLFRALYTPIKDSDRWGLRVSLVIAAAALLFTPFHIAVITSIAGILLLRPQDEAAVRSFRIPDHISWLAHATGSVAIVISVAFIYFLIRFYSGEVTFLRSLKAAETNNGTETYNLQIAAISANPYMTNYHVVYSQTNLAIADAIAQSATATASGEQAQLSEEDRRTISQLIQQAIREAKIATSLAPDNVFTWETLGRVYQNIIPIVQGADAWAIAAFQRAVQLDPTNPAHRLNQAGIYITQNNLDAALRELQAAQFLKPDAAVVYYNLAYVYGARKEYVQQAAMLKQTLSLLPQGSEDAQRVMDEFEAAKGNLNPDQLAALEGEVQNGSPNQAPLPEPEVPQPEITPKLELPEEASPAVSPVTTQAPERL